MTTQELKYAIHESIENIDDEELLNLIKEMLSRKYDFDRSVSFSEHDLREIDLAREQINKGNFKTGEEIDQLVSKWAAE